jgi:hypothetical protein
MMGRPVVVGVVMREERVAAGRKEEVYKACLDWLIRETVRELFFGPLFERINAL